MMVYVYLAIALIAELIGTIFLKLTDGFSKLLPSAATVFFYSLCFFFLSKALLSMKLSVVYATWCAVGIVGATLVSVFFYKEHLNMMGVLGIVITVIGVVMVNVYGTS